MPCARVWLSSFPSKIFFALCSDWFKGFPLQKFFALCSESVNGFQFYFSKLTLVILHPGLEFFKSYTCLYRDTDLTNDFIMKETDIFCYCNYTWLNRKIICQFYYFGACQWNSNLTEGMLFDSARWKCFIIYVNSYWENYLFVYKICMWYKVFSLATDWFNIDIMHIRDSSITIYFLIFYTPACICVIPL